MARVKPMTVRNSSSQPNVQLFWEYRMDMSSLRQAQDRSERPQGAKDLLRAFAIAFQKKILKGRHARMFLAGIHVARKDGFPLKARGNDAVQFKLFICYTESITLSRRI
jgi:hypothetical protein